MLKSCSMPLLSYLPLRGELRWEWQSKLKIRVYSKSNTLERERACEQACEKQITARNVMWPEQTPVSSVYLYLRKPNWASQTQTCSIKHYSHHLFLFWFFLHVQENGFELKPQEPEWVRKLWWVHVTGLVQRKIKIVISKWPQMRCVTWKWPSREPSVAHSERNGNTVTPFKKVCNSEIYT